MRKVVVLPQPEGPSMATNSPCLSSALKSITARAPPGKVLETCSRTTSNSLMAGTDQPAALATALSMFHTESKGTSLSAPSWLNSASTLTAWRKSSFVAGMLAEPRDRLGERHFPRLLGAQMLLHQRIEVLVGLLQRAAVVRPAEQALDAVGAEPLAQPLGDRLRDAFEDLADAEALGEQAADGVHGAVAAAIHADLRLRQRAAHRLRLIDVNVALGLDPQFRQFEESRGVVVFLERFGLGFEAGRLGFQEPLRVGDAQRLDLHLGAPARAGLALDAIGADLLRLGRGAGADQGRLAPPVAPRPCASPTG